MRITSGGNVGIGTTNPGTGSGAKLEVVQGTSTNAVARLVAPSSKTSTTQEYPFYITTNEAWASNPFGFEFGLKGNSTSSSRIAYIQAMTVNSSNDGILALQPNGGNVGIGTSSPTQLVEASKSVNDDVAFQITNANSGGSATAQFFANNGTNKTQFFHTGTGYGTIGVLEANLGGIYNTTTPGIAIIAAGASGVIKFATGGTTERMRITNGGELLLNTTTDAGDYKLQVNGNALISGSITTAAPSGGTAQPWKLGTVITAGCGFDVAGFTNQMIEVDVNGTLYYLPVYNPTYCSPDPFPQSASGPNNSYTSFSPIKLVSSDNQKIKDLEKEIAELKELIKSKIK